MIHKVLEEWFDTLLYVGIVTGLVVFFCIYWGREWLFCQEKVILQEFLDETAISGKITQEEYAGLNKRLYDIHPEFSLEIYGYQNFQQHLYDMIPEEKWRSDFAKRNQKKHTVFNDYELQVYQTDENCLQMQTETNASVLAADRSEYLPLPKEETGVEVCAVRPFQEVYEDESLITLCRITDSNGMYYKEAAHIKAEFSGEVLLELTVDSMIYKIPVQVVCYPRIEQCDNGHLVVNTWEVIEEKKVTGKIRCPYCSILPERIICVESELHTKTGEKFKNGQIGILVTYLNGNTEYVSIDSKDWQDDFDSNYCGTQEVTIRYRNMETKIMMVSENPLCEKCAGECNDRSYEDYVKYPYCLECLSGMYLFTGEIREEEVLISKNDLLSELESKGEILLNRGDFFVIVYKSGRNVTALQRSIKIDGKSGINK